MVVSTEFIECELVREIDGPWENQWRGGMCLEFGLG